MSSWLSSAPRVPHVQLHDEDEYDAPYSPHQHEDTSYNVGINDDIDHYDTSTRPSAPHFNDRYEFYRDMAFIFAVTTVAESSRGIVIPTIKTYCTSLGGSLEFLGALVAAFSLGRLVSSVVFGYLSNWSIRNVLAISLVLSTFGNLLYGLAPLNGKYMLLFARLITGFGTGTLSVGRAYIARETTPEERTRFISYSGAAQFLGFSLMPGLGSALAGMNFRVGSIPINGLTAPGYFMMIINIILFALLWFCLDSQRPDPNQDSKPETISSSIVGERVMKYGVALFLMLNFVLRGILGIGETIMPVIELNLAADSDGDALQDSGQYFLALGVIGFVVYLLVPLMTKKISERNLLCVGILTAALGFFVIMDFDMDTDFITFTAGAFLVWSVASPICQTLVVSSFSKMLGSKPQGGAMGWITAAGSLGRICFPLLTGFVPDVVSFLIGDIMCGVCLVCIYAFERWKTRLYAGVAV